MSCFIVVGTQWGDEGKGKIIDLLSEKAHHVIRSQGGNNAGHTVQIKGKEYKFNLIPSGILHPQTTCYLGPGTVIDLDVLFQEIAFLQKEGIEVLNRLIIAPQAHIIFPYHILSDKLFEIRKGELAIGTTGRGIGPCYADKINRIGITAQELIMPEIFAHLLKGNLIIKNEEFSKLYQVAPLHYEALLNEYLEKGKRLAPFVKNYNQMIASALKYKETILLEGAQGTYLDVQLGTYPYVTSSSTTAGGLCAGAGIAPNTINHILGVIKAYTTRVGNGPFPTELHGKDIFLSHLKAKEYGTTTGRKRRIGWFDAVLAKNAVRLNGLQSLAVTKLDILDHLEELFICTAYELEGNIIDFVPSTSYELNKVKPIYQKFAGWKKNTSDILEYNDLPVSAKKYLNAIETMCEAPISILSLGPDREQTIILKNLL